MSLDLAWGDPIVVRQALSEVLGRDLSLFCYNVTDMGYPPHYGDPALIENLRYLAGHQSGIRPKYLFVTCGASGAINAALYALKTQQTDWVVTDDRYFPMYPAIIGMTDMIMINKKRQKDLMRPAMGCCDENFITLVASPSNPDGVLSPLSRVDIWDAAYQSKVYGYDYNKPSTSPTSYRVMCGSVGKSLGLAGLRLGWVSTDDDAIANSLKNYILASYVGLSCMSMKLANQIVEAIDLYRFEQKASSYIDNNREEVEKIISKFGQGSVSPIGMFATLQLGRPEKKALEKAKVKWQPGSTWGEDDTWARLSLGQDRQLTKKAVKAVLK